MGFLLLGVGKTDSVALCFRSQQSRYDCFVKSRLFISSRQGTALGFFLFSSAACQEWRCDIRQLSSSVSMRILHAVTRQKINLTGKMSHVNGQISCCPFQQTSWRRNLAWDVHKEVKTTTLMRAPEKPNRTSKLFHKKRTIFCQPPFPMLITQTDPLLMNAAGF